ncbi:hypothetical protein OSB04_018473 [Centaurea solstitialis]|uniref:SAM-dependent MTase DRM-type domain-containing protein n=1 Tax=Centaurea solstitialis TaxID=347529 RepID=A0AA38T4Y6_9ASTR|nr:hypothetical protein OSB04_018473 [Centaurea solstitialis]
MGYFVFCLIDGYLMRLCNVAYRRWSCVFRAGDCSSVHSALTIRASDAHAWEFKWGMFSPITGLVGFAEPAKKKEDGDDNSSHEGSVNIDWTDDDEQDSPSSSVLTSTNGAVISECGEKFPSNRVLHFMAMGFPEATVTKVIAELGEDNADAILDTLLTYSVVDETPKQEHELNDPYLMKTESHLESKFLDLDSIWSDEDSDESSEKDDPLVCLIDMGYPPGEASAAISRCGKNAPLSELMDFISATRVSKGYDTEMNTNVVGSCSHLSEDSDESFEEDDPLLACLIGMEYPREEASAAISRCGAYSVFSVRGCLVGFSLTPPKDKKKRKFQKDKFWSKNKKLDRKHESRSKDNDHEVLHLPNPMVGFGVPRGPYPVVVRRTLPEAAMGPPYFYYENVALTPKGVWNRIKSFLYEIDPEFVDSKYFCAAARKRGYIHNLPLENRFPIQPLPPLTIFEALPGTRRWWPSWDNREQLNCILTCIGSAQLTDRIRLALDNPNAEPSLDVKKFIIGQCKKWNMVWTGKTKVAPLEPDEIELIMGYPLYHTRGVSRVERYKGLGNAFQVDTVAYHLSVLKNLYPNGMNVLSLFSGIGGAEIALHRLGIPLNNVVSVEKSEVCRNILQGWWEQTNQKGNLVHLSDVQEVTVGKINPVDQLVWGFDLVIGAARATTCWRQSADP